jgi:hypothetical protein
MPFIGVASDFAQIHSNKYTEYIYKLLNFKSEIDFLLDDII